MHILINRLGIFEEKSTTWEDGFEKIIQNATQ